ncbi:MAG: transcription termination/antitermination NusG family protein [Planctomycetaceae bacterium]
MPILKKEIDQFPDDLLALRGPTAGDVGRWWALYTRSRREKDLMRRLVKLQIAFYCPVIEHQHRSPQGRLRTSYIPLFSNYVFLRGDEEDRHAALTTSCISRDLEVKDPQRLVEDLRQIRDLIARGIDLTPEARIEPGTRVRVKAGALAGQVGTVIERRGQKRLLVAVDFLQQGASVELTPCDLETLDS